MARIKMFFPLKAFSLLFENLINTSGKLPYLRFKASNDTPAKQFKFVNNSSFTVEVSDHTLVFHLEGAVLKSYSQFPYFMLVAFEAGGPIRALILLLLYPLACLLGHELGLRLLVFVSFVGIKKDKFRVGSAILPKFFLDDVGAVGFDIVMKYGRKVAVTGMPRIMVECFLREYLGTDAIIARNLKEFHGYFLGLMEENIDAAQAINQKISTHNIGLGCFRKFHNQNFFLHCKEIYLVTEAEKYNWQVLPREKYIKPLIFHDGRLAFRPTPLKALAMFLWLPFGFLLHIIRIMVFTSLPFKFSIPLLAFSGMINTKFESRVGLLKTEGKPRGVLYVCNHRTLLDPVYITIALMKSVSAVTYSLSWFSEVISPIKTVRLTRNREKDREVMKKMLSKGDLVVCPEGTTCREPYLLRFSPLFTELTDEIVPVAIKLQVSMFYGSTASGFKCLDSTFHLMNPNPSCMIMFLNKLPCWETHNAGGKSRFEVANHVQGQIATALGFDRTDLTRKDKYMILAGNKGII
ncbi:putative glycerol-3-phosphate acyltransferase 2 [Hibiscus syriacus]|uniref:Glycerol-3-phosphate acyltransferase 2 n=1 Tax=Hibiscus syriacus TaxID=106335 RepID=A0A6A3CBT5_HIBSY|nr:probable glycerol-3-phosphate acyltransferase 3 [Hibiscus syriacus]KAE8726745.1 putative glycerol-3-phosphate acyltransferase 2 [Hibiscus syriacus]